MKKVVGMLLAASLIVTPTFASAASSFDGNFLIAKKGGNGNSGGGNGNSNSSSSKSSSADKSDSSKSTSSEVKSNKVEKIENTKSLKTSKEEIIKEKTRLIEEYKNNKPALKAKALELRQQLESKVETDKEKAELLETTADLLEEAGELDEAITTQEEAVQEDLTNVDRYKKLAKLMEKKGNKGIKAFVNGKHPVFDVPPVIKSGRTLVPIRAISQSLGATVTWNPEDQTAIIVKDGVEIKLVLNEVKAYIDGKEIELDVPSSSINGRIVVPLRFISEAFDSVVKWEDETDSVIIVDGELIDETTDGNATEEETTQTETDDAEGTEATSENEEVGNTDDSTTTSEVITDPTNEQTTDPTAIDETETDSANDIADDTTDVTTNDSTTNDTESAI